VPNKLEPGNPNYELAYRCLAFIELFRAVPLITVLFMASVMLPLFLSSGVAFDKLPQALIGVALFNGALMAEVIRGGLRAVPKGEYEAATAAGMGYWRMTLLIVLPRALQERIRHASGEQVVADPDNAVALGRSFVAAISPSDSPRCRSSGRSS